MALDILHLRQEDWRAEFGDGDLQRGQGYAAQGRSRLLSLKDSTLLASCAAPGHRPISNASPCTITARAGA